jgi:arsenate reductase
VRVATRNASQPTGLLFVCVANSARSQMAEGLARQLAAPGVAVYSAGSAPGAVHPHAVAVMKEIGIDIASQRAKPVSEVPLQEVGTAITLCAEESCPRLPAAVRRLHWPLEDPAASRGPEQEVRAHFRRVRDEIRRRLEAFFSA